MNEDKKERKDCVLFHARTLKLPYVYFEKFPHNVYMQTH